MTQLISLATLNGMPTGQIPAIVDALGDRSLLNPVADWIQSRPWDGEDRLPDFYATLVEREGFPPELKQTLMRRWLLSAVAAALSTGGFRCRGVLTLQGPQGIGKTAWTRSLISDAALAQSVIKLDHHLDAGNKDSLLNAVTHWFVEIGELDGSLRRENLARLKGFLTDDQDKVRRPYGRVNSEYARRTVFCATVNDANFLVDTTGNTRWWVIPVTHIDHAHGIDMQQLFAQVARSYYAGEKWWLTAGEERQLDEQNLAHRSVSALRERLLDAVDLERLGDEKVKPRTPTETLEKLGIDRPSNHQAKECGSILREVLGEPRRIHGRDRWRVPFRKDVDCGFPL
jgi:putative DNA primase/helicase